MVYNDMSIRLFDWRDIPTLHQQRNNCVFLHSSFLLTRGTQLLSSALLSTIAPTSDIVTAIINNSAKDSVIIGQTRFVADSQSAQMTFITPIQLLNSPTLPGLLDYLAKQMGGRGAYRLIADVDESNPSFEAMRRYGFAIYTRQRIWKMDGLSATSILGTWQPANDQDIIPVNSLYHNVVPGLVQQVESNPRDRLRGMVFRQAGELLGYAELKMGHRGIWIQPVCHPDVDHPESMINGLLQEIPNRFSKPVYLCIRSYLSWLEPILEDLGAQCGTRQAVMVKQLTIPSKVMRTVTIPALEGGHPEVSAPIAHSERFE